MASVSSYTNNLVYAYLQNKAPKCAALFSKSNEVGVLPPECPALEDIIKIALVNKGLIKDKLHEKDSQVNSKASHDPSSDSSSESDKYTSKSQQPTQRFSNVSSVLKKEAQDSGSSSDSSDSDPVKSSLSAVKSVTNHFSQSKNQPSSSPGFGSNSGSKHNLPSNHKSTIQKSCAPFRKAESSSDSSDSEDEKASKVLTKSPVKPISKSISKLNVAIPNLKNTTLQSQVVSKQDDSSSSSSSESDHTGQLQSKSKAGSTNNFSAAISNFVAQFSDSDSESEDEKGVIVSLSRKHSTPMNNDHIKKIPSKLSVSSVQKDSSDDSSSESGDEIVNTNTQITQPKSVVEALNVAGGKKSLVSSSNTVSKGLVQKLPIQKKKGCTSSDSSSDSEDDEPIKSKSHGVHAIESTFGAKNVSLSSPSNSACERPVQKLPIAPEKKADESSSDSSSDSEDHKSAQSKPQGAEKAKSISFPSPSNSAVKGPIQKSPIAQKKKTDDTSSDSSYSEDEKHIKVKPQGARATKNMLVSSPSHSAVKGRVQKSPFTQNLKASETSSDSSSDSENDKLVQSRSHVAKGTVGAKNVSLSGPSNSVVKEPIRKSPVASKMQANDTSSDTSDSEDDKLIESKPHGAKNTIGTKNMSFSSPSNSMAKGPVQKKKADATFSDSSSGSENDKPIKSKPEGAQTEKSISGAKNISLSISSNSLVKGHVQKSPVVPKKKANDTSSDSSSESEDNEPGKLKTQRAQATKNSLGTKNISFTSLSNLASKESVPKSASVLNNETSNSSADSSSESEEETKPAVQALFSKQFSTAKKISSSEDDKKLPLSSKAMMHTDTVGKTNAKSPKSLQNTSKKDSSDSSSGSDHQQSQVPAIKNIFDQVKTNSYIKPSQKDTSSDSDSEEERKKPAVSVTSKILKNTSKPLSSKKSSDSSDSSSQSEPKVSIVKPSPKNMPIAKKYETNKTALNKDDSSSSSDSDEEPAKNVTVKPVSGVLPSNLKSTVSKKTSSDSSSDSSDGESNKHLLSAKANQNKSIPIQSVSKNPNGNSKESVTRKAKHVKVALKANGIQKSSVDNSTSSSDSEDEAPHPVNVSNISNASKNHVISKSLSKNSTSSDSSSEDDQNNTATQKPSLNTSSNFISEPTSKRPQQSSSDSESTVENKSALNKKVCLNSSISLEKSKPAGKQFIKLKQKDSSSDSSSSEDEKQMNTSAKLPVGPLRQKEAKQASSDSSSESENDNLQPKINNIVTANSQNSKRKRSSSSSDSESENSHPKTALSVGNKPLQKVQKINSHPTTHATDHNKLKEQNKSKTSVASDSSQKRRGSSPFRRIKTENVIIDYRMKESNELAKHGMPSLGAARGKQFRHEKTKKKKGGYSCAKIDPSTVKSIKFD